MVAAASLTVVLAYTNLRGQEMSTLPTTESFSTFSSSTESSTATGGSSTSYSTSSDSSSTTFSSTTSITSPTAFNDEHHDHFIYNIELPNGIKHLDHDYIECFKHNNIDHHRVKFEL